MNTFYFLIAFVFILTFTLLFLLSFPPTKGWAGELLVRVMLKSCVAPESYIFNDLYFHNGKRSCQIDHLVVAPNGVFVIETKNYFGEIIGSPKDAKLRRRLLGMNYYTKNPIYQNNYHLQYLKENIPVFKNTHDVLNSVVVFVFLTRIKIFPKPYNVINLLKLPQILNSRNHLYLSDKERQAIIKDISTYNRRNTRSNDIATECPVNICDSQ